MNQDITSVWLIGDMFGLKIERIQNLGKAGTLHNVKNNTFLKLKISL